MAGASNDRVGVAVPQVTVGASYDRVGVAFSSEKAHDRQLRVERAGASVGSATGRLRRPWPKRWVQWRCTRRLSGSTCPRGASRRRPLAVSRGPS
eukprot:2907850-Pyramimonas_sp.AAC.1